MKTRGTCLAAILPSYFPSRVFRSPFRLDSLLIEEADVITATRVHPSRCQVTIQLRGNQARW
jgi:hypothetical protein